MNHDSLDDLPANSRSQIVADVRALLGVDAASAEDIVRSAEPLWDAMERTGGLVDSWGGGEFVMSCRASWPISRLVQMPARSAPPSDEEPSSRLLRIAANHDHFNFHMTRGKQDGW